MSLLKSIATNIIEYIKYYIDLIVVILVFTITMFFTFNFADTVDINDLPNVKIEIIPYLISSGILLIMTLWIFTKFIIVTNGVEFGVRDAETGKFNKNNRFIYLLLFSVLFVTATFILLDVFFPDVPLFLPEVIISMQLMAILQLNIPGLTDLSALDFYNTFRNVIFDLVFLFFIFIPVIALGIILTSRARERITKRFAEGTEQEYLVKNFFRFLAFLASPAIAFFILVNTAASEWFPLLLIAAAILAVVWLIILYRLIRTHGRMVIKMLEDVLIYAVLPLIGFFWILPAIIATAIEAGVSLITGAVLDEQFITITWNDFTEYLFDPFTIVVVNFLILTLIATLVVGIGEGLSIVSLGDVLRTDVAGIVAIISVLVKTLLFLTVWGMLLYKYLREVWLALDFELPEFLVAELLDLITGIMDTLASLLPVIAPILFIVIPLYIVMASAFRFFITAIIAERIERMEYFMIITSTACVLILLHLLADAEQGGYEQIPFKSLGTDDIFGLAMGILPVAEAFFFFLGAILVPVAIYHYSRDRRKTKSKAGS